MRQDSDLAVKDLTDNSQSFVQNLLTEPIEQKKQLTRQTAKIECPNAVITRFKTKPKRAL